MTAACTAFAAPPTGAWLAPQSLRWTGNPKLRLVHSAPAAEQASDLLEGVDVSHYQGKVDWRRVAADGKSFAYLKCTEGSTLRDDAYSTNWWGAREAGLRVGSYHFMTTHSSAEQQAEAFLSAYGSQLDDELPPALDVEVADGIAPEDMLRRVLLWLRMVEDELGVAPVLYTYSSFPADHLRGDVWQLARHPLWIAHPGVTSPRVPSPWKEWAIWQKSFAGRVPGIATEVDLNVMRRGAL